MMYPFEDSSLSLQERIGDLLSRMTLEEKISFLSPFHPAIERLSIPAFGIGGEAAHGLVGYGGARSTVFPQPFGLSMTWDKALMKKIGCVIGDEARVYHNRMNRMGMINLFFPTIDMERDPRWGRNEEAYGEDPFLAGKLAVELIRGAQGEHGYYLRIAATPKHFYANNFEFLRTSADSVIADERLKYEYYLRVFEYAFKEGRAASLMTAYNKINGIPGMVHPEMNTILRAKWGADAFFISDGGAFKRLMEDHNAFPTYAEAAAAAIKAGLDCFLDDPDIVKAAAKEAVNRGLLTEEDIDIALRHQFSVLFRLGAYGGSEGNPYLNVPDSALCSDDHSLIARQAALESVVLLKNDGILPLGSSADRIAVIGNVAKENLLDWYSGTPPYQVTPLEGIMKAFPGSEIVCSDACDTAAFYSERDKAWLRFDENSEAVFDGDENSRATFRVRDWGFNGFGFQNLETGKYLTTTEDGALKCDAEKFWGWFLRELFFLENGEVRDGKFCREKPQGTMSEVGVAMRKGVSVYDKPYKEGAADKINEVLGRITVKLIKDGAAEAVEMAKTAKVAVVTLGNHPLVGARECIDRETLDLPEGWRRLLYSVAEVNDNTILALIAGYPFALEEEEKKVRAVIFTTHGAQEVGTAVGETISGSNDPAGRLSMTWYKSSDVLPDINDYDIVKNKLTYLYHDKPVLHEFGFGLSYTRFEYGDLEVSKTKEGISVDFSLTNAGKADGDEVPQVYFTHIDAPFTRPIKQLAGFDRLRLKAGETRRVSIPVPLKELEYYDISKGAFSFVGGSYMFEVGASSTDIRLSQTIGISATDPKEDSYEKI